MGKPRLIKRRGWWECGLLIESRIWWASGPTPWIAFDNWKCGRFNRRFG